MGVVDPTYPLYPIVCTIAATAVLLVFVNVVVRQKWNLGVIFLCFWLGVENILLAVNAILWSDNADLKLYVYCDIGTGISLCRIRPIDRPFAS